MIYSYTQISQFLACPRRYRYRYLDGWKEKETRSGLLFGRAFESALAALFRREDASAVFFEQWSPYQPVPLDYSRGDSWQVMYEQGLKLLHATCRYGYRSRCLRPVSLSATSTLMALSMAGAA